MNPDDFVRVIQQALLLVLILSAPALLVALVLGTIISVLQAATHIQESSLLSVPKILAVSAVLALAGLWMLSVLVKFGQAVFAVVPQLR
jgi:flagellar biosynthesis protein FliQ